MTRTLGGPSSGGVCAWRRGERAAGERQQEAAGEKLGDESGPWFILETDEVDHQANWGIWIRVSRYRAGRDE